MIVRAIIILLILDCLFYFYYKPRRRILIAPILIVLFTVAYFFFKPENPALTPVEHAEYLSKLNLPDSCKVIKYEDIIYDPMLGDRTTIIELSVDSANIPALIVQCKSNGYKPLPITDSNEYYQFDTPPFNTANGFYQLNYFNKSDLRNIEYSVLDTINRVLLIELHIM